MKRLIYILSIAAVFLSMSFHLSAQVQVTGRIIANDQMNGLSGATINLQRDADNLETESTANGSFIFNGVMGSAIGVSYCLKISHERYQTYRTYITVRNQPLDLGVIRINEYAYPVRNVLAEESEDGVRITWDEPEEWDERWIHWDSGVNANAIGTETPYQFSVAHRYTPTNMIEMGLVGLYITSVKFFPREENAVYTAKVWRGGSVAPYDAGEEVYSKQLFEPTMFQWNEVELEEPVYIGGNQEIWFGYHVQYFVAGFPAGVDAGPQIENYGNLMRFGTTWNSLFGVNPQLTYNWNIHGYAGLYRGDKSVVLKPTTSSNENRITKEERTVNNDDLPLLALDPNNAENENIGDQRVARRLVERGSGKNKTRELLGYRIYRFYSDFAGHPDEWTQLAALIDENEYIDRNINELDDGRYIYAVQAVYTNDVYSAVAFSNNYDSAPEFSGGEGTVISPWQVATAFNLRNVRKYVGQENNDRCFVQTANIDLGVSPYNKLAGWLPIGSTAGDSFMGSYDGDGFIIENLTLNRESANQGLFGYTNRATIENVILKNVKVQGQSYTGGLVGYANDRTNIRHCSVSGQIAGLNYVGGLVGYNNNSTVTRCLSSSDVTGTSSYTGGLIGYIYQGAKAIESGATGNVKGTGYVGGLVGDNYGILDEECGTMIDRCFSAGTVTSTSNFLGGLVGRNYASIVKDSYSSATVTATATYAGSVAGYHSGESTMSNCYGTGYTTSTTTVVGGLIGQVQESVVGGSYWDRDATGQTASPQGISKNTAEMVRRATFENWNFDNIWRIDEGNCYPYLAWQETVWQHNIPGPISLSGSVGDEVANLTWQAPAIGTVAGYRIYRDGTLLNPENLITEREYQDTSARNFLTYTYKVSAVLENESETAFSNTIVLTPFVFEGGTGEADDPYLITEAGQLHIIRFNLNRHFKLANDIDLDVEPYNTGDGWLPIGTTTVPFTGSLDGNGFKISNMMINRPNEDYQGFFCSIQSATIKKLALEGVEIIGRNYVGGITGRLLSSNMEQCFVSGKISGSIYVGGLFGMQSNAPTLVKDSYSVANVASTSISGYVGGLAGYFSAGSITNCYSIGNVGVVSSGAQSGGLLGHSSAGINVVNCYWNIETSGMTFSPNGGEGKTAAEMIQPQTFNEWDFEDVWSIGFNEEVTYPFLRVHNEPRSFNYPVNIPPRITLAAAPVTQQAQIFWSAPSYGEPNGYNIYRDGVKVGSANFGIGVYHDSNIGNLVRYSYNVSAVYGENESSFSNSAFVTPVPGGFAGGLGTEDEPYQVETAVQLNNVRHNVSAHYVQIDDISLANVALWNPIGSSQTEERFFGYYDGGGYEITDMNISLPTTSYVGLFGWLGYQIGGVLKNINVRESSVVGNSYVGGILGRGSDKSIIENCSYQGNVTGGESGSYIGGLVGYSTDLIVTKCRTAGRVTGNNNYTGGLIGYSNNGDIADCFTTSSVRGGRYVGGFCGYHRGTITNSYARGDVTGETSEVGGFIAQTASGDIVNSYSTGRISAPAEAENVGGFIGNHTSGTISNSYWDTQTSGKPTSAAGEGRTTDQMTYEYAANTYINWDFDEIWRDDRTGQLNDLYPYLYCLSLDVSPNPTFAVNPQPQHNATNIPITIEEVNWSYYEHMLHTNPVGFKVYMNLTGIFGDQDPFVWVPFIEGEENYSCTDVIPANIAYGRTYHWRVVPTTTDPTRNQNSKNRRSDLEREQFNPFDRGDAQNCPIWKFTVQISSNPATARNPQPANEAVNVPINLPVVAWVYTASQYYTNPVGFRLYMNTSGEFDEDDDFLWVPYIQGQANYSNGDILPERIAFNTNYYWKIVPTTDYPNRSTKDEISSDTNNRRRGNSGYERDSYLPVLRGDAEDVPVWSFHTVVSDPRPHPAHDPEPEHLAKGVSLKLNGLKWQYEAIEGYALPAGFRVYLNTTGGFPGGAPFCWVPYEIGKTDYICTEATDDLFDSDTTHFWRVIPSTTDPNYRSDEENTNRNRTPQRDSSVPRVDAQNVATWRFTTGTTDIDDEPVIPLSTELFGNYPNPFNPETTISFSLCEEENVTLEIFNSKGQRVIALIDEASFNTGIHRIHWNGKDQVGQEVGSGIYFCRLKTESYIKTIKMIMIR